MQQPKKPVKKYVPTAKERKNTKDATIGGGINSRPIFDKDSPVLPLPGRKGKNLPKQKLGGSIKKAKNGKSFPDLNKDGKVTRADILKGRGVIAKKGTTIKKAQTGVKVNNDPKKENHFGYNPKTSPIPNLINKGNYEKKLDTIGKAPYRSVRLLNKEGKVLGQERLNTAGAKKMTDTYNKNKTYTEERRKRNTEFLEGKQATGKAAEETMKKSGLLKKKTGGTIKKCKTGCK